MTSANGERERFAENHVWFEAHLSELMEQFRGRFVAIDRGVVLADSPEVQPLARRFGQDPGILIEKVIRPADEMLFVF